jgi:hypothetical protein
MSERLPRRILMAWPLALAFPLASLPAGCGGKPAETDTAEVVTKTAPAPAAEPSAAAPAEAAPATNPAEAKPQG